MKLRMLKSVPGAIDGMNVKTYEEGEEYEIGGDARADDLARAFLKGKFAQVVAEKAPPRAEEPKKPNEGK